MSGLSSTALTFGDLKVEGWSRAGEETWFRVHPPGLAFDVGRGSLKLAGARDLFLSHGHLDHALGVPFVLSQRTLHQLRDTRVFCPAELVPPLTRLIEAAAAMEEVSYRYQLVPLVPGDRVSVGKSLLVEAFRTDHVVPSLGFHLLRRKRRLAAAFRGLAEGELAAARAAGKELTEEVEEGLVSYLGDTGPGVFASEPRLFASRVLLMELTFLGPGQREKGRRYRHLHFEDLAACADRFANEALVLHHLSRRHRPEELRRLVAARLAGVKPEIHVLADEG